VCCRRSLFAEQPLFPERYYRGATPIPPIVGKEKKRTPVTSRFRDIVEKKRKEKKKIGIWLKKGKYAGLVFDQSRLLTSPDDG